MYIHMVEADGFRLSAFYFLTTRHEQYFMSKKATEIFFICYGGSKQKDMLITLPVHLVKMAIINSINP